MVYVCSYLIDFDIKVILELIEENLLRVMLLQGRDLDFDFLNYYFITGVPGIDIGACIIQVSHVGIDGMFILADFIFQILELLGNFIAFLT